MHKLQTLINSLEMLVESRDMVNLNISKSSVGWHIEHSLLTINKIIDRLETTKPGNYKRTINFPKILVFTIGKIPRGRAKAPGVVTPGNYDEHSLTQHISKTNHQITKINHITPLQYFEHPYFGHLRLNETVRFLEIHTKHHLAIMKDITRTQKGSR